MFVNFICSYDVIIILETFTFDQDTNFVFGFLDNFQIHFDPDTRAYNFGWGNYYNDIRGNIPVINSNSTFNEYLSFFKIL